MVVPHRSQARLRLFLVPTIRNSRLAALPLARLPPLSSAWSLRIVRKLTRGAPCFTGLIGGYCSHWLRRLFRPHWTSASPVSATGGGEAPSPLGLLRAVSRTARALRALPQFAMVALLRLTACSSPLLIGLTSRCFAHCARASCAPRHYHILNSQWSFRMGLGFFNSLAQCPRPGCFFDLTG